jgi:hypothetical protein
MIARIVKKLLICNNAQGAQRARGEEHPRASPGRDAMQTSATRERDPRTGPAVSLDIRFVPSVELKLPQPLLFVHCLF